MTTGKTNLIVSVAFSYFVFLAYASPVILFLSPFLDVVSRFLLHRLISLYNCEWWLLLRSPANALSSVFLKNQQRGRRWGGHRRRLSQTSYEVEVWCGSLTLYFLPAMWYDIYFLTEHTLALGPISWSVELILIARHLHTTVRCDTIVWWSG